MWKGRIQPMSSDLKFPLLASNRVSNGLRQPAMALWYRPALPQAGSQLVSKLVLDLFGFVTRCACAQIYSFEKDWLCR